MYNAHRGVATTFTKLLSFVENLVEFCSGRRVACRPRGNRHGSHHKRCAHAVGTASASANRKIVTSQKRRGNSLAKVGRALRSAPEQDGFRRGGALRRARPTAASLEECFGAFAKDWSIILGHSPPSPVVVRISLLGGGAGALESAFPGSRQ